MVIRLVKSLLQHLNRVTALYPIFHTKRNANSFFQYFEALKNRQKIKTASHSIIHKTQTAHPEVLSIVTNRLPTLQKKLIRQF